MVRGGATLGYYRKTYGINKIVDKTNAKVMMRSLAAFTRLAGYRGLVILFDEANMSYSVMRKSQLKDAHNNLLHLINNVEELPRMFLLYATTPDFYTDNKYGIRISGMLSSRIGLPQQKPPRALDLVWNIDKVVAGLPEFQSVGRRIRTVYAAAYPEANECLPAEADIDEFVARLLHKHPKLAPISFWRVLTAGCVKYLDNTVEGEPLPAPKVYEDVMATLRDIA